MDPSKGNEYAAPGPGPAPPSVTGFLVNPAIPVNWSTGLCDCTEDCGNCCMTCWCPCVTFGQIADIVDRDSPSCGVSGALYALIAVLTGYRCINSCFYRSKLRAQYGLPESPCPDFLVHCRCEACALWWHGNMERRGQGYGPVAQPPSVQGGMTR